MSGTDITILIIAVISMFMIIRSSYLRSRIKQKAEMLDTCKRETEQIAKMVLKAENSEDLQDISDEEITKLYYKYHHDKHCSNLVQSLQALCDVMKETLKKIER